MNNIDAKNNLKSKHNYSTKSIVLIVFILIGLAMIVCGVYLNSNQTIKIEVNNYLSSIEVRGYNLDKPFSKDEYEYNLNVNEDIIQIVCETEGKVEGCNETIDLTNKEKYVHKIIVNNKEYKITINKIIEKTELRIISINGNPLEWTNKDVEIEVNAISNNGVEGYSFDGGKTYQESNKIKVKENKILNIVIKDKKGNTTEIKEVKIDKIDKEIPKVEIIIESKTKDEIKLKVMTIDNSSGIEGISFNNSEYTQNDTYTITKTGKYKIKVKDKAGNVSDEFIKEIKESDFAKQENAFIATFHKNGANTSREYLMCTTDKDSCSITLPTITRNGYEIIGWATNKNSTTAKYKSGEKVTIKDNVEYYAITKKTITTTFNKNGADAVGKTIETCNMYNTDTNCSITLPTITRNGYEIIGWATNKSSTATNIKIGETFSVSKNRTYYAITKKVITITFNLDIPSRTCTIYNNQEECNIVMPEFNISGSLNGAWGLNKENTEAKYKVGTTYKFSNNTNLYASIRHPWGDDPEHIYKKVRNIDMQKTITIGNKIIEYESVIPSSYVDNHVEFLNNLYKELPCLFVPGKVFIMGHDTYYTYSRAYGLTHMYGSYSFVDLQYDNSKVISINATVHEFAHTWDFYYSYKTGKSIQSQQDFINFYKSLGDKLTLTNSSEIFAAMFTNYYWHVLEKDTSKEYYGLCSDCSLTKTEKNSLKTIIEKYINISNNGY